MSPKRGEAAELKRKHLMEVVAALMEIPEVEEIHYKRPEP